MKMRLSDKERDQIVSAVKELDSLATVYLFGSRTKLELKGGDIDLLVLSDTLTFSDKVSLLVTLKAALGDQKIDLSIKHPDEVTTDPWASLVCREGVKLG